MIIDGWQLERIHHWYSDDGRLRFERTRGNWYLHATSAIDTATLDCAGFECRYPIGASLREAASIGASVLGTSTRLIYHTSTYVIVGTPLLLRRTTDGVWIFMVNVFGEVRIDLHWSAVCDNVLACGWKTRIAALKQLSQTVVSA